MRTSGVGMLFMVLCSSILFVPSGFSQAMESDMDRPGMNYRNFDLSSPDPMLCENACKEDPQNCKAWTYVKPEIQGPKARCWLKSGIPSAVKNSCCISGMIQLVRHPTAERALPGGMIHPVPLPTVKKALPEREKSATQLPLQPQAESKKSQTPQGQVQLSQLPQDKKLFKAMAEQKLRELRTTAELKRKSEIQRNQQEIAVRMKNAHVIQPCDTPRIKSVSPTEVHPGYTIFIEGCGFQSKQGSKVVTLYPNDPSGPFLPVNPNLTDDFPAFQLWIYSWTDTAIEGFIPLQYIDPLLQNNIPPPIVSVSTSSSTTPSEIVISRFSKPLIRPVSLRLRVEDANILGAPSSPSPTILLNPYLEIAAIPFSYPVTMVGDIQNDKICLDVLDSYDFGPAPSAMGGYNSGAPLLMHLGQGGVNCEGKDHHYLENVHLRNSWVLYDHAFYIFFLGRLDTEFERYPSWHSVPNISSISSDMFKPNYNLNDFKGKSSFPQLTISWRIPPYEWDGLKYTLLIFIQGPEGTLP